MFLVNKKSAIFLSSTAFSQKFIPAFDTFSGKKTAIVVLEDGTKVEGTIKDLDRKKGQIESIKLKFEDGKKVEYEAEEIKHMYLPPSGFDKSAFCAASRAASTSTDT